MKPRPLSAQHQPVGTYTKKLQPYQLARQDKRALGVIHPIPTTKPRSRMQNLHDPNIQLIASKANMKSVFQDRDIGKLLVPEQLVKPFLYVQQVVPKRKTEKTVLAHPDVWQPAIAEKSTRKPRGLAGSHHAAALKTQEEMQAHKTQSLYDIQTHKRDVALQLFQMLNPIAPQEAMKKSFWRWAKDRRLRVQKSNMPVDLPNFKKFIEEYSDGKVSPQLAADFFTCFKRPIHQTVYIKALSYNFQGFRRSKVEVANILSQKAAKTRYLWLRDYVDNWNANFPELNGAIKEMGVYQNSLREYFSQVRGSYSNPHADQIQHLKGQLEQPMVKYDAVKKKDINASIQKYLQDHKNKEQTIETEYQEFLSVFEDTIVQNHNMFFRKKTIMDLLTLVTNETPAVTKEEIEGMIARQQLSCEQFLKTLSEVVNGFCIQKGKLKQDKFTLIHLANYVHRYYTSEFEMESVRQLVRLIKEQYCLKHQKTVGDLNEFPGEEEIDLSLLTTCFEIECTKILFKNDVWNQLIQQVVIPESAYASKFHSVTINKNVTFESVRRLLEDIDKSLALELNKSRELSQFMSTVTFQTFGEYASILLNIDISDSNPLHNLDRAKTSKAFFPTEEPKKVKFADMIFTNMSNLREAVISSDKKDQQEIQSLKDPEYRAQRQAQENSRRALLQIQDKARQLSRGVMDRSKTSFEQSILFQAASPYRELATSVVEPDIHMKTMARSFIVPQPINMNALDARYHQQAFSRVEDKKMSTSTLKYKPTAEQDIHIMGNSVLLSHLPKISELPQDPLRVSKYLMTTLQKVNQQVQEQISNQKNPPKNIRQGVNSNYYKEMVDLEKRPYKIDCQGTTKYSMVLPVDYYSNVMAHHDKSGNDSKWYLKPHHVQSLTEHPKSKKDNFVGSDYQIRMDSIQPKKSDYDRKTQDNIQRKDLIINELEDRLSKLKRELSIAKRSPAAGGGTPVPTQIVQHYFNKLSNNKESNDLEEAASKGILYDLRSNERQIINSMRQNRLGLEGDPNDKWWQKSDKTFVQDHKKNRLLVNQERLPEDQQVHTRYIQNLKSNQLY